MHKKKILAIVLALCGIVAMAFSSYIQNQIDQGTLQVRKAQKMVDQGNSLFSLNPVSKEVGKGMTGSAQKKIDAGKEEIAHYQQIANLLKVGGIVLIVAGVVIFFLNRKK